MSLPSTAQCITIAKTGGLEVIEKTIQPLVIKPDHIVIKVEYLGVNFIDTYHRKGVYPVPSFPATLGQEAAGTIIGLPTDQSVLGNKDYKKRNFCISGKVAVVVSGAHASYLSVPWIKVYPVPDSVSTIKAASSLLQSLTAVTFMSEAYNVKPGDSILVHTVAGGLGLIMAQLARHIGATVIGTTSTEEKAMLAKANGAQHVILYPVEDTVQRVLDITKGEGVDAVFDGVGKDTFDNNFKLVKRKGTLVCLGNASGVVPPFSPLKLGEKNLRILRPIVTNYLVTPDEILHYGTEIFDFISKGTIDVKVFKEYSFTASGYADAHRDLTGGKTFGKLVIKVAEE